MGYFIERFRTFLTLVVLLILVMVYQSYSFAGSEGPASSNKTYRVSAWFTEVFSPRSEGLLLEVENIFPNEGKAVRVLQIGYGTKPSILGQASSIVGRSSGETTETNNAFVVNEISTPVEKGSLQAAFTEARALGVYNSAYDARLLPGLDYSLPSVPNIIGYTNRITTFSVEPQTNQVGAVPNITQIIINSSYDGVVIVRVSGLDSSGQAFVKMARAKFERVDNQNTDSANCGLSLVQ